MLSPFLLYKICKCTHANCMIILTIAMAIVVVLLLPIHVGVSCYVDLDNDCLVVLMSLYGVVFFDSIIDTDGANINYKGSVNGSIAIVDIEFVDIDDILRALQYRSINCQVSADINNCKYMGVQSTVLALASMIAPIINDATDTVLTASGGLGRANYINVSCNVSTTPSAIFLALH